jgi:hypothetical protein
MELDDAALHVLSCDISIRPRNAAGIAEVLPYVRNLRVDGNKVIVHFDEAGKMLVESFVKAERLCCTDLTWELANPETRLELTIQGTSEQVSIIENWFEDSQ